MTLSLEDIGRIGRGRRGVAVLRAVIEHVRPGFLHAVATQHPQEVDSRGSLKPVLSVCIGDLSALTRGRRLSADEFDFIKANMDRIKTRPDHPTVSRYYWLANYAAGQDLGQLFMTPEGRRIWGSSMHDWNGLPPFDRRSSREAKFVAEPGYAESHPRHVEAPSPLAEAVQEVVLEAPAHSIGLAVTRMPTDVSRSSNTPLRAGETVGQYRVVRLLGRGGMGEVYEVEHSVLHRRYAMKLLPTEVSNSGGARQRFEREAEVMANLDHPHIVRVDDFGESTSTDPGQADVRCWLRMDLANGVDIRGQRAVSLQDLAAAYGGRIEPRLLAGILGQVLAGLAHAHARGVVHRDLKPSNILIWTVGAGSVFKIADFGLARLVGEDWLRSRAELTVRASMSLGGQPTAAGGAEGSSTRSLLGTYEYMSPEQKRGEEVDARSDIYAVGLMAYRLLTGRGLGMKRPSEIVKDLDPRWDALVLSAVEEEREERPAGCAELLEAVKELAAGGAVGTKGSGAASKTGMPRESSKRPVQTSASSVAPRPGPTPDSTGVDGRVGRPASPTGANPSATTPPVPAPLAEEHKTGDSMSVDLGGGVKLDLVWISPGEFVMGSPPDEIGRDGGETQHRVCITQGFWMAKFPVTQRQYHQLIGENPARFKEVGPDAPVETVDWNQARAFCVRLTSHLSGEVVGLTARLPTEAEWEYACRAGTKTALPNGKPLTSVTGGCANLDAVAWYDRNGGNTVHPVGQKKANTWGLHDMLGNVWEWCEDWYGMYSSGSATDPTGTPSGTIRVFRGGSWNDVARFCRSADRGRLASGFRSSYLGFRVVVGR